MSEVRFIADRLDARMQELGYTDETLADKTGIGKTTIYYLRKGRKGRKTPHVSTSAERLSILARALSVAPEYFIDEAADRNPNQKKMSAAVADIAGIIEGMSPARQRDFREIARALDSVDQSTNIDDLYNELMEIVARLAEISGGKAALRDLITHVESLAAGASPTTGEGGTWSNGSNRSTAETTGQPSQSDQ